MVRKINKLLAIILSLAMIFTNQTIAYGSIDNPEENISVESDIDYENTDFSEGTEGLELATPSIADAKTVSLLSASGGFNRRMTAPEAGNPYYYNGAYNPFAAAGYIGECTWYVWGRAYEILGYRPNLSRGHASSFYSYNVNSGAYPYGNEPKVGAIACFAPNNHAYGYGHVAIVEIVGTDGSVGLSEYNFNVTHGFTPYRYLNPSQARTWVQGYIYIRPDDPPQPSIPDHIAPPSASDPDIADGDYTIVSEVAEGRSVAWEGNADTNGQNVLLANYFYSGDYVWTLERQSDDSFIVKTKQSGKLLDIFGGPTSFGNGKNAQVWENVPGNANQRWYIVKNGAGYRFIAKHSGYSLDVMSGSSDVGTNIWQYYPNESSAQRFYLVKHDIPVVNETSADDLKDNATYVITPFSDTMKAVSTESDPNNMVNGRNVYLWEYAMGDPAQIWKLEKQSDGSFLIKNTFNNQYMDVVWDSLSDRSNIITWERHYKPSESWYIVKNNDTYGTYRIINKNSGKVMDVTGGQTANGTNIQQYVWHDNPAQMFFFKRYPEPVEYTVVFKAADGSILSTQKVEEGESASAIQPPAIEGYEFVGWEGDFNNVHSDVTVTAKYNKLPDNNAGNNNNTGDNNSGTNNTGNSQDTNNNTGINNTGNNGNTNNNTDNTGNNSNNNAGGSGNTGGGSGGGRRSGGGSSGEGSRSGGGRSGRGSSKGGNKTSQNSAGTPGSVSWQRDAKGWWIKNADGSYPKNEWKQVNNSWYFFNSEGYMFTGWLNINGGWYYLNTDEGGGNGMMVTGWKLIVGKWYYLSTASDGSGGRMLSNTVIDGYTLGADGAWVN